VQQSGVKVVAKQVILSDAVQTTRMAGAHRATDAPAGDQRFAGDGSATPSSAPVLLCRGVRFAYAGTHAKPVWVLQDVDFCLHAGERVAVVGESGSGKSTLLHLAAGLERPQAGSILVQGVAFEQLSASARAQWRRQTMGIVFQAFHLIPTLTALENVALPLELAGLARGAAARERSRSALADVGLAQRGERYPEQLSGGEQQRVAIARALVHEPTLILADEPTGNLDSVTGEAIFQLLLEQVHHRQCALLMVTHSLSLAQRLDRSVRMVDGRLDPAPPPPPEPPVHAARGLSG
jgi:predicted ABC-type transport system involved in lysophospholipase L1 biosynthesis ATPase subunit